MLEYFALDYFVFSVHDGLFCVFCAHWVILCMLDYFEFSVHAGLFCFLCMLEYFAFSVHAGVF